MATTRKRSQNDAYAETFAHCSFRRQNAFAIGLTLGCRTTASCEVVRRFRTNAAEICAPDEQVQIKHQLFLGELRHKDN
eukprot:SAG31_NODE_77_length_27533_cov_47.448859_22_plen_79_part_00